MDKLAELRRKLGVAVDELNTDAVVADATLYAAKENEIKDLEGQIARGVQALHVVAPGAVELVDGLLLGGRRELAGREDEGRLADEREDRGVGAGLPDAAGDGERAVEFSSNDCSFDTRNGRWLCGPNGEL